MLITKNYKLFNADGKDSGKQIEKPEEEESILDEIAEDLENEEPLEIEEEEEETTSDDEDEEEPEKTEEEENPDSEEEKEPNFMDTPIPEEFIEESGLHFSFTGKSMKDVATNYRNVHDLINRQKTKINELIEEIDNLKAVANQVTSDDKYYLNLENMPDPVNEPDEFKKFMTKRDEIVVKAKVQKEEKSKSKKETSNDDDENVLQNKKGLIDYLSTKLNTTKFEDAVNAVAQYAAANQMDENDINEILTSDKKTLQFARNIFNQLKVSQSEDSKNTSKSKTEGDDKIKQEKNRIKNTEKNGSDLNSNSREQKTKSIMAEIAEELIAEEDY